jgi:hypothetical protein
MKGFVRLTLLCCILFNLLFCAQKDADTAADHSSTPAAENPSGHSATDSLTKTQSPSSDEFEVSQNSQTPPTQPHSNVNESPSGQQIEETQSDHIVISSEAETVQQDDLSGETDLDKVDEAPDDKLEDFEQNSTAEDEPDAPLDPLAKAYMAESRLNDFFARYVDSRGHVRYDQIQSEEVEEISRLLEEARIPPNQDEMLLATLINAYNFLAIKQILHYWPLASPLDEDRFFKEDEHQLLGLSTTLSDLEESMGNDPRLHFALVCAAKGCPPLYPQAAPSNGLEHYLEEITRKALNNPGFIRIDEGKSFLLSEIFAWYTDDFGGRDAVPEYINRYRKEALPEPVNPWQTYPYDWRLNWSNH